MSGQTQAEAEIRARDWCAAWNRCDLEAVLVHYAEDVELCSPLVISRQGRADGGLRVKAELRAYFGRGMTNPALRFEFEDVRRGVDAMAALDTRENGMRVCDMGEMDGQRLIWRVIACYAGGESAA